MTKPLKKQCDKLWTECVKARAGYKSEVSGKEGKQIGGEHVLHAHHIARKPNYRLRYELDNGICLTAWEHRYGIHGDHEEEYREKIKDVRGANIYQQLLPLRNVVKIDLQLVKIYLEQELAKYENL